MATKYAATTGSDVTGDGSIGTPWQTPEYLATHLSAGDTGLLRGGTYPDDIAACTSGSSWVNKVRIANYPGETIVIKPSSGPPPAVVYFEGFYSYIEFDGINIDGTLVHSYGVWTGHATDHIRFKNSECSSKINSPLGQVHGYAIGGSYHELLTLKVHGGGNNLGNGTDSSGYGIYLASDGYCVVDGCDIYDTCMSGIQVYSSGYSSNNIIRNNRIHDINRSGDSGSDARCWGIIVIGHSNEIYNNLFYNIGLSFTGGGNTAIAIAGGGNRILNNTVFNCGSDGISISSSGWDALVRNNIVHQVVRRPWVNDGAGTTEDHNIGFYSFANPGFVNAGAGDFRIASTSVAYRSGLADASVTTDFAGTVRNNPPSVGAYDGDSVVPPTDPDGGITVVFGNNTGDDIAGVEDTFLEEGAPTTNYGAEDQIVAHKYAPGAYANALIRIDLSAIVPGDDLSSAALEMYVASTYGASEQTWTAYRVKRAWTEGGATWNKYDGSSNFGTPGCLNTTTDIDPTPIGTMTVPASPGATFSLSGAGLIGFIEDVRDSVYANEGLLFVRTDGADDETVIGVVSCDGADGMRPRLTTVIGAVVAAPGAVYYLAEMMG